MADATPRLDLESHPDDALPPRVVRLCQAVSGAGPVAGRWDPAHSNDLFELRTEDGRILMVKRARHTWAAPMFESSRLASAVLRDRAGVVAPEPLGGPGPEDDLPLQAYWRVQLPTLADLWPGLDENARHGGMRSLGALLRRVHELEMPGWGPIADPRQDFPGVLRDDLAGRLLPAVQGTDPVGAPGLRRLIEMIPPVAKRAERKSPTLVHNDLHMANVLCRVQGSEVHCVGLLDLDETACGPAEADLAGFEILHGPHFRQQLETRWLERFREGYGGSPDELVVTFYRATTLANQAFYSSLVGHREHAAEVRSGLELEIDLLEAQLAVDSS